MWSNARMDRITYLKRDRDAFSRALEKLPRVFLVRWLDDEAGWKAMQVIANTAEEAAAIVQPIAGRPDLMAYPCAI